MKTITYALANNNESSNGSVEYYADVERFTNIVLAEAEYCGIIEIADELRSYTAATGIEAQRSTEEYLLDLLIAGVLWETYIANAKCFREQFLGVFTWLLHIRSNNPALKSFVDRIRGILTVLLRTQDLSRGNRHSLQDYSKLIKWLTATGEFHEEVKRLKNWETLLSLRPLRKQGHV